MTTLTHTHTHTHSHPPTNTCQNSRFQTYAFQTATYTHACIYITSFYTDTRNTHTYTKHPHTHTLSLMASPCIWQGGRNFKDFNVSTSTNPSRHHLCLVRPLCLLSFPAAWCMEIHWPAIDISAINHTRNAKKSETHLNCWCRFSRLPPGLNSLFKMLHKYADHKVSQ